MYNLAENLALIAQLKSVKVFEAHKGGELVDITNETVERLEREIEWLKNRQAPLS